jgi:hypothetical protein
MTTITGTIRGTYRSVLEPVSRPRRGSPEASLKPCAVPGPCPLTGNVQASAVPVSCSFGAMSRGSQTATVGHRRPRRRGQQLRGHRLAYRQSATAAVRSRRVSGARLGRRANPAVQVPGLLSVACPKIGPAASTATTRSASSAGIAGAGVRSNPRPSHAPHFGATFS